MKNRNLGDYDMVLALSSSYINFQFKMMYRRKIIADKWAFLTNSMGKDVKPLLNAQATNYFHDLEELKKESAAHKKEIESIEGEMENATQAKWKKLRARKKTLKNIVAKLEAKIKDSSLYDVSLVANIAPQIEVTSNPKELLFQIAFTEGSKLTFIREGKKIECDLSPKGEQKTIYAFRVKIGKVKITSNQKIISIDEGKNKVMTLRDKGINDNDFTVESLFLDFENANISDYDKSASNLPDDVSKKTLLLVALENYFRNLKGSDNPYILGYGITKKKIKPTEKALFQPTGIAYSSNSSKEANASSFNFLMLLEHHAFPSGQDAGILPHSLLEQTQDKTATVDAGFGLSRSKFERIYVKKISDSLKNKIATSLGEKCKNASQDGYDCDIRFAWEISDKKDAEMNIKGNLKVIFSGITLNQQGGVDMNYITKVVDCTLHQEIPQKTLFYKSVGVDWPCSTSGKERAEEGKEGKEGKLTITLKADAKGKFAVQPNNDKLRLGFDTFEPKYKDRIGDKISNALTDAWNLAFNTTEFINDLFNKSAIFDEMNALEKALDIKSFKPLENKVILPVSSVYTYKNVRLDKSKTVVLFDASYAPITE